MDLLIGSVKAIHVIVSLLIILTILLQPGKGGDLGSMFGGGTSESVFGSSGAVPFLTKVTRILAVLFILSSLSLGYFSTRKVSKSVISDTIQAPVQEQSDVPTNMEGNVGASTDQETVTNTNDVNQVQSDTSETPEGSSGN